MKHRRHQVKLNRKSDHRRWLLRNLAASLVEGGKLKTTLARAKFLQSRVEELVSLAKREDLEARRRLYAFFPKEKVAQKLLGEWAPLFRERGGGYTRLTKLSPRRGDSAPMASLEFVARPAGEKREGKKIRKVKRNLGEDKGKGKRK